MTSKKKKHLYVHYFWTMNTLNCNGVLIDLSVPLVMGILNVTPDSFYDGGKHNSLVASFAKAEQMIVDGATIIDVGGMSSRPGAEIIDVAEEIDRVIPVIKRIKKEYPDQIISIDTVHGAVAEASLSEGASMINDISAGSIDPSIMEVAMKSQVPYILMHMQGKPSDMQKDPSYNNVVMDILSYMKTKVFELRNLGLNDIIIDPGFGFGKTITQNYSLLDKLSVFKILECPVMIGISRKSMIYEPLDISAADALNGTTAAHMIGLRNGAKVLRVHDVKEAVQAINIHNLIERQ
jgi:dihydropteroate synthase